MSARPAVTTHPTLGFADVTAFAFLGHGWLEWTAWCFGLVSVVYIILAEARIARKQRQLRRIASELEPSGTVSNETFQPPSAREARVDRADDRLRSVLIQVAVDGLPFSLAVERSRRFKGTRVDLEATARKLRDSKLLRFDEPLTDDTVLRLS